MDYISRSFTVQFNVGVTYVPITVPIINDNIMELNETFHLNINASSLPSTITAMGPAMCTVIILENDCEYTCI